jgi:hypothetical protein
VQHGPLSSTRLRIVFSHLPRGENNQSPITDFGSLAQISIVINRDVEPSVRIGVLSGMTERPYAASREKMIPPGGSRIVNKRKKTDSYTARSGV